MASAGDDNEICEEDEDTANNAAKVSSNNEGSCLTQSVFDRFCLYFIILPSSPPSILIFNLLSADFNMQLLALTRNEEVFFRFENQEITEKNITGT